MCKHKFTHLYRATNETDAADWYVANATSNNRQKREVVCLKCGILGYQRRSRRAGVAIYPNQMREALQATILANELKLSFPQI